MTPMKPPASLQPYFEGTLSLDQLARRWSISHKALRELLASQQLDFVLIADRIRIPLEEVLRYERNHPVDDPAPPNDD